MATQEKTQRSPWQLMVDMFPAAGEAEGDEPDKLLKNVQSGFPVLLKHIAESFDAAACVLWEEAPIPESPDTQPRFFTLGAWYESGNSYARHNVSAETKTGKIILGNEPESVSRLSDTDTEAMTDTMRDEDMEKMLAVPLRYVGGSRGSLNVYRRGDAPDFLEQDKVLLSTMAEAVPLLIRRDRERIDLIVLEYIESTLHKAELLIAGETGTNSDAIKPYLQEICAAVAKAFQCLEVSIILEDSLLRPGEFELWATTWEARWEMKHRFKQDSKEGCVGYCLAKKKSLRIFNVLDVKAECAAELYPGLCWSDMGELGQNVRSALSLSGTDPTPSISSMLVPIVFGGRVIGLIRCTAARIEDTYYGPYYFAQRDQRFLHLVAGQISRYWRNWLDRMEVSRENAAWKEFIQGINELNQKVVESLNDSNPNLNKVYKSALELLHKVVPAAAILDIRLHSSDTNDLYFHTVFGEAWEKAARQVIKEQRFPISTENPSIGVKVYLSGEPRVIDDVRGVRVDYNLLFPETHSMIIEPIRGQEKTVGLVDIRSCEDKRLPTYTQVFSTLLARQLALYSLLLENVSTLKANLAKLKQTEEKERKRVKRQQEFFLDLAHQLRTPVINALTQAVRISSKSREVSEARSLRMLVGQMRRCYSVVCSMQLMSSLLSERPVSTKLATLDLDTLKLLLINLAEDAELMTDPEKNVSFGVERGWLWKDPNGAARALKRLRIDTPLLQQALGNLLDNASKYSYANTAVEVSVRLTKTEQFAITVGSTGLRLTKEDCRRCMEREWRSEDAASVQGSGTGLGLWIVDHIMKAHGGRVEVRPTDSSSRTEFTLIFPSHGES